MPDPTDPGLVILATRVDAMSVFDASPEPIIAMLRKGEDSEWQANARKSAVRSAVEHVFARQRGPMGLVVRIIGLARARVKIGLATFR